MMTRDSHWRSAEQLRQQLDRQREASKARAGENGLHPDHRLLSDWQSQRLARTHADLMCNPRYRPALEFFLDELYGPKDFSQRDRDIERVYPLLIKLLPSDVLQTIARAIELNVLSYELDSVLIEALGDGLHSADGLTEQAYARAYRICDNYPERLYQIELIRTLGEELDLAVDKPLLQTTLRLARQPARYAGLGELQDFLEWGFRAFRHTGGAQAFLDIVVERERRILDRIFAAHPVPFALEEDN